MNRIIFLILLVLVVACKQKHITNDVQQNASDNNIQKTNQQQINQEFDEQVSEKDEIYDTDLMTDEIIDQVSSQDLKKYILDKYFISVKNKSLNDNNQKCLSLAVNNDMQKNHLDFDAYYYCVTDILEKSFSNNFGKYKFLIVTGNYANLKKTVFNAHNYQGFFIPFLFKQNNKGWDLIAKSKKDYFTNDFGQPLTDDDCEIVQIGKETYALNTKFEFINKGINEGWQNIIYSYKGIFQELELNTYFYDSTHEKPKIDLVFNVQIDNKHKNLPMYPILLTIGGSYIKNNKKYEINDKKTLINFNKQQGQYLIPENSLYNDLNKLFLLNEY